MLSTLSNILVLLIICEVFSNSDAAPGEEGEEGGMPGGGGGGFGGSAVGSEDFDFGDEEGEETGSEGEMDMNAAANEIGGEEAGGSEEASGSEGESSTMGETFMRNLLKNTINEQKEIQKDIIRKSKNYTNKLAKKRKEYYQNKSRINENVPIYQKNFLINEDLDNMVKQLEKLNK